MGAFHFKQMHADAIALDARAYVEACVLYSRTEEELANPEECYWHGMPFDKLVDIGRRMVQLGDWYHAKLKRMLIEGAVHVFMVDDNGRPHRIRDPRVIDFDEPELPIAAFEEMLLKNIPGEFCSHEQKVES